MSTTRSRLQAQDEIMAAIKALADKEKAAGNIALSAQIMVELDRLKKRWGVEK